MYSGWAWVDVDGTLVDSNDNPRPYIKELFETIKELNLILVVWSGGGREYAEQQILKLGKTIYNLVDEFKWKGTPVSWSHIKPAYFIDDSAYIKKEHTTDGERVFLVPFYHSTTMLNDAWLVHAANDVTFFMKQYNLGGERKIELKTLSSSG